MIINKIGAHHLEYGENNQDFGIQYENKAIICDGCGSGKHSEIGAKLFCLMMENQNKIYRFSNNFNDNTTYSIINKMIKMFQEYNKQEVDSNILKNLFSFTILMLDEIEDAFRVQYCGDGFVILQNHDKQIYFEKIDSLIKDTPEYFIYNFVDKKNLTCYTNDIDLHNKIYSYDDYYKIGIASDGLRYVIGSDLENEFIEALKNNNEVKIKRMINMHPEIFKDDITLIF